MRRTGLRWSATPATSSAADKRSSCVFLRFKEGDLNVGENSCIDRCSSKYWQARVRRERRMRAQRQALSTLAPFLIAQLTRTRFASAQVTAIVGQMLGGNSS